MSARSRALTELADHFDYMAEMAGRGGPPLYTAANVWERAATMARHTAVDATWTIRIARRLGPWASALVDR